MLKKTKIRQAVILCGGLGSRLKNLTLTKPKPMINCQGKPFLFFILRYLSSHGIKDFLLLTGYKSKKIESFFSNGKKWNWNISYSEGEVSLDTGSRLLKAQKQIQNNFVLLYSDNFIPINFSNYIDFYKKNYSKFCLISSKKKFGNLKVNNSDIKDFSYKRKKEFNSVDLGFWIINKKKFFLKKLKNYTKTSQFLNYFVKKNLFKSYDAPFYKSISDQIRLKKTRNFLKTKKIIFLDRDGIINIKAKKGEYIKHWKDFVLIEENILGLKKLSKAGYKFIIISNQAGVGRGLLTKKTLQNLDTNMKKKLDKLGINILSSYYCVHHWNKNCECRKPNPGLFFKASEEWNLRLDKTLYIGDDKRDCIASFNSNCKSVFIGKNNDVKNINKKYKPLYVSTNINKVSSKIIKYMSSIT